jgi:hypothetical protein
MLSQVGLIEINRAGKVIWHLPVAGAYRVCFGLVGVGFEGPVPDQPRRP